MRKALELGDGAVECHVSRGLLLDLKHDAAPHGLIGHENLDAIEAQLEGARRIAEATCQPILAQDQDLDERLASRELDQPATSG